LEELVSDPRIDRMLRLSVASRNAIVLIGPPGTGKTTLAHAVARRAASDFAGFGLSSPPKLGLAVTPDESWTALEIVGGPTIVDSHIVFRPGHVLRSISQNSWLLLDEANRGDLDKILGPLLTWLSRPTEDVIVGRLTELHDAPIITIGWSTDPECRVEKEEWLEDPLEAPCEKGNRIRFLAGKDWRLLATYNAVDAQRVFRFGQALGRRFATVPVPPPSVEVVRSIIEAQAQDNALPTEVAMEVATKVAELYGAHRENVNTALGPAAFLEIPRYVAAMTSNSEDGEPISRDLDNLIAEGYLVNVGHSLARQENQRELLRPEIVRILNEEAWIWLIDQLNTLG
jgi:MoxR-like ATPase